jgi:hypothetical protein
MLLALYMNDDDRILAMEDRIITSAGTVQRSEQRQALISKLPPELLGQILNYLNYPGLSSFLDSCHLFKQFPTEAFVQNVRELYIDDLLTKEQSDAGYRQVCARNLVRYCMHAPINDIHQSRTERAESLVCYTCYSELPRARFLNSQITGNRSYGHSQARRRFCIGCGIKRGKWVPGTYFNRHNGGMIVCISCRDLKETSREARTSKLCNECHEQQEQNEFMLRRLSYFTEASSAEETEETECTGSRSESEFSVPSSASSLDLATIDESREVICRRCWIVDHTVTKIKIGVVGQPERSLCDECTTSK